MSSTGFMKNKGQIGVQENKFCNSVLKQNSVFFGRGKQNACMMHAPLCVYDSTLEN